MKLRFPPALWIFIWALFPSNSESFAADSTSPKGSVPNPVAPILAGTRSSPSPGNPSVGPAVSRDEKLPIGQDAEPQPQDARNAINPVPVAGSNNRGGFKNNLSANTNVPPVNGTAPAPVPGVGRIVPSPPWSPLPRSNPTNPVVASGTNAVIPGLGSTRTGNVLPTRPATVPGSKTNRPDQRMLLGR